MKEIKRTSSRQGPVITDTYSKEKVRNGPLGIRTKSVKATTVTDLANKTTQASGMKTKMVTKGGVVTKMKTNPLSARNAMGR